MTGRRFPPPWSVEGIGGCFVVKSGKNRPLVFIYYGEAVARRSLAKLLTRDAARRIAAGIAKQAGLGAVAIKRKTLGVALDADRRELFRGHSISVSN